jgi:hypothetical protein
MESVLALVIGLENHQKVFAMIDHTLSSSLYLYTVNRDRELLTVRMQGQRKSFWLVCLITAALTTTLMIWICYG